MSVRFFASGLAASLLLLAACRKTEVTAYRIPKEKDPAMPGVAAAPAASPASTNAGGDMNPPAAAAPGMAGTAVPTATGEGLAWTAPGDWKPKPLSAMRKGSYAVPGEGGPDADLSITAFPGDVGGELANVNRWRGQVQLPPIGEADLATNVMRFEHDGLKIAVVDLASANGPRILGAMVPYGGATWFFKLGPAPGPLVEKQKTAFLDFVKTIHPAAATTP